MCQSPSAAVLTEYEYGVLWQEWDPTALCTDVGALVVSKRFGASVTLYRRRD